MAAALKAFPRSNLQGNTRIGGVHVRKGYPAGAPSGIVQIENIPLAPFQDQEMLELPKQNEGHGLGMQLIYREPKTACLTPVVAGRHQYIHGAAAVPRHPAVHPQPFEGDVEAVIGQHHGQRGRAAFGRLHLQNGGNPHSAFDSFFLTHPYGPCC